jgi:hypothetical protein
LGFWLFSLGGFDKLLGVETASPGSQQNTDSEHLKLLSIFHYVVGGMAAFFACIPILHLVIGLFLILAPEKFGHGSNQPPAFIGWFFVVFASIFILMGWTLAILILLAGRFIACRKYYPYCFIVACVECLFMPFGTVLGVFTILVLNRQSVKPFFDLRAAV